MNTEQLIREVRAKIMWGESRKSALEFLQQNGIGDKDALVYIDTLFRARAADIRKTGIKKIVIGALFVALLLAYLVIAMIVGVIELRLLVIASLSALVGAWKIVEGILFIIKPASEGGDLSALSE